MMPLLPISPVSIRAAASFWSRLAMPSFTAPPKFLRRVLRDHVDRAAGGVRCPKSVLCGPRNTSMRCRSTRPKSVALLRPT